jgi:hypothetical protein
MGYIIRNTKNKTELVVLLKTGYFGNLHFVHRGKVKIYKTLSGASKKANKLNRGGLKGKYQAEWLHNC